ncbi:MAG: phosphonate C-P lyase system protein PhnG [Candidatus Omnitrophica bacterium]|nr:phosphonate C-P lyase system protein PhnG [Candidatus Omnitrophota bacterium]
MKRKERFELIAIARKEKINLIAEEVRKSLKVKVIKQNTALIMMRARDSVEKEVFNLGEVLVSEAWVEVSSVLGYSLVLGDDIEKALGGAILDAVCELRHPLSEKIVNMLKEEKKYYEKERAKEWMRIKSTKVKFEVMAKR